MKPFKTKPELQHAASAPPAEAAGWPPSVDSVDWTRPWLQLWRSRGEPAWQLVAQGQPVASALNQSGDAPVVFVPQSALAPGEAYERHIFDTGTVPTRDNLHDFFNGLCWQHFPATKRRLNRLQAQAIATDGVRPVRGPLRDALTLFDENAAVLIAPGPLWQALAAREWRRLFVELRPLWAEARLVLFGHALLEKLVSPRKAITAHVYLAQGAIDSIVDLDAVIAADLDAARLATKPFLPLPVLGVPGWCFENENFSFYDDPLVFRPGRVSSINTKI